MKAPFTMFGTTLDIPVKTYTNGKEDKPPKEKWDIERWFERGEDWYALGSSKWAGKTIRVVERSAWLRARETV